jgi:hypothetical protein
MIWDFTPQEIAIEVKDAANNNLLDAEFEGNILENGITATFWGKTYELNKEPGRDDYPQRPKTRAVFVQWSGLQVRSSSGYATYDCPVMTFGEFAGDGGYYHEQFGYNGQKELIKWL